MRRSLLATSLVLALWLGSLSGGCRAGSPPGASEEGDAVLSTPAERTAPPAGELYQADSDAAILSAARALIAADRYAALVTADAQGRPRVRTVYTSPPDDDMTIWVATRPSTRKVEQIRNNPAVALYFSEDDAASYVSVMGTATLHGDLEAVQVHTLFEEAWLREFWPDYPKDFLLVRIEPQWIEVVGGGIEAHPETWRPQAVRVTRTR